LYSLYFQIYYQFHVILDSINFGIVSRTRNLRTATKFDLNTCLAHTCYI